jgi:hypothetical protein
MADEERKPETYEEFLEYGREKCRLLENSLFETEAIFRYKAREPWWNFIENTQKMKDFIMSFEEFWGSAETYPRTIAIDPPEPKK